MCVCGGGLFLIKMKAERKNTATGKGFAFVS